jgi:acyl-CoA thioesterase I
MPVWLRLLSCDRHLGFLFVGEKMKTAEKWFIVMLVTVILTAGLAAFYLSNQQETKNAFPIRIACVGDSITEGTEYPTDLGMMLGTNYTVRNFGVGGATASLESDKPYMNQVEFQEVKQFKPNLVVIMLGTNDAYPSRQKNLDNFTNDYEKLANSFQSLSTKPKIFLVIPPPVFNAALGPNNTILLVGVIPRITQAATELGLPTVDVYSPLMNHADYFWDGVHPNNSGAKIIAAEIYNAITKS